MTRRMQLIGASLFAVLSLGVLANMLLMQSVSRGRKVTAWEERKIVAREIAEGNRITTEAIPPAKQATIKVGPDGRPALPATTSRPSADDAAVELVRAIQRELHARGYETGGQDGLAGQVTRAAIMAFEHDVGLPVTAEPSDELLQAIVLGSAPSSSRSSPAARRPSAEQVTKSVQASLTALGYLAAGADHRGEDLARAIREFEMDQGLPRTGRISGSLVSRLARTTGRLGARR